MIGKLFTFKEKTIMFITCFVSILLMTWAVTLSFSIDLSYNEYLKEIYGEWQNAIVNTDEEMINRIENRAFLANIGKQKIQGKILANGNEIGNIGSVDDSFIDIANIKISEGRLPAEPNEIAVEEVVLDTLTLDKCINQKIVFDVYCDQETVEREYILVGIIEDYSLNWVKSDVLVNCISYDNGDYEYMNGFMIWENAAQSSIEAIPLSSGNYISNSYYEMSEKNTTNYFGLLIPVFCIVFFIASSLVSSHVKARRKEYCILLTCGAKTNEIKKSLYNSSLKITFLAVVLGFAVHIPLSLFSLDYLRTYYDYSLYTMIPFRGHLLIVLVLLSVVIFSVSLSCNQIKKISITDLSSRYYLEKNDGFVFNCSKPSFFIRNILIHRKEFALILMSMVVSLSVCFYSLHKVFYSQRAYQTIVNSTESDYTIRLTGENLYGYTKDDINILSKITGIESVKAYRKEIQRITFDDIENSAYYNMFSKDGKLTVNILGVNGTDYQSLYEIEQFISEGEINFDEILKGNEAVVVLPVISCDNGICKVLIDREFPLDENDVFESKLHPGVTITLTSDDGEEETLVVSGIVRSVPLSLYEKYGEFMVITGNSIFDNQNSNLLYLSATDESSAVTDLLVSQKIGSSLGIDITNQRIVKQQLSDSLVNTYIYSVIIFSLSMLIELMIIYVSLEKVYSFFGYQRNTLLLLGINSSEEKRIYLYYFQRIILVFVLCFAFWFLQFEYLNFSTVLQRGSENVFDTIPYSEIFTCLILWLISHLAIVKHQYNSMRKIGEEYNENFIRGR